MTTPSNLNHPLPVETYVVKIGGSDPKLVQTEQGVVNVFQNQSAFTRAWRVRLTILEELEYVPPGHATLRARQPDSPPACPALYHHGPATEPTQCTYTLGHEGYHSWKEAQ